VLLIYMCFWLAPFIFCFLAIVGRVGGPGYLRRLARAWIIGQWLLPVAFLVLAFGVFGLVASALRAPLGKAAARVTAFPLSIFVVLGSKLLFNSVRDRFIGSGWEERFLTRVMRRNEGPSEDTGC
jgi:hypothetical protein